MPFSLTTSITWSNILSSEISDLCEMIKILWFVSVDFLLRILIMFLIATLSIPSSKISSRIKMFEFNFPFKIKSINANIVDIWIRFLSPVENELYSHSPFIVINLKTWCS